VESRLPPLLDALYALHGHDGLSHQIAIVLHGTIASFLEFERRIDGEFLTASLAVGLRPCHLAGIALLVEIAMAFGTAETKRLGIVADEHYSVAGVTRGGAEVTFFDAHFGLYMWRRVLLLMNLSEWDRESLRYAHDNNMESLWIAQRPLIFYCGRT